MREVRIVLNIAIESVAKISCDQRGIDGWITESSTIITGAFMVLEI